MKALVIFFLIFFANMAVADDLEEASGLPDIEMDEAPPSSSFGKVRSYILMEGLQRRKGGLRQYEFPNGEFSGSLDYSFPSKTDLFLDGLLTFDEAGDKSRLFINQVGVRQNWQDNFVLAVGKERSRRAPGLIISPSDLLFTLVPLPGQREDRQGVWLTRLSFQQQHRSYDLILLPVDRVDEAGLPGKDAEYFGTTLRTWHELGLIDMGLSLGSFDTFKAGLALQTLVENKWKFYYEGAYHSRYERLDASSKEKAFQHLLGAGYEGSTDFGMRVEYFHNGIGFSKAEFENARQQVRFSSSSLSSTAILTPFIRQQFLIFSANAPEVFHRYNFFAAIVKSLEDTAQMSFVRAEYLANDWFVAGASQLFVHGGDESQFAGRAFNTQTSLDLKYSF
ncbi:MAG: hypothetical protein HYW48_04340 [Deltaproteobacteria bacterium]|nr:hypothetical protein [Deltaproteobacteria bacterium]